MSAEYNASHMRKMTDRAHIRYSPSQLLVSVDSYGQYHMIKEIIDNAIDEVSNSTTAQLEIYFFQQRHKVKDAEGKDTEVAGWQVAVIDTGRGFPPDCLKPAVEEMKFSGKFETDAYATSSGLYGYGLTVATSLCNRYRMLSNRGNVLSYYNGNLQDNNESGVVDYTGSIPSGTCAVLEVAPQYFTQVDIFRDKGYEQIVTFLKVLSIFSNTISSDPTQPKYKFYLATKPLDEKFWSLDANAARDYIQTVAVKKCEELFNSLHAADYVDYLSKLWECNSNLTWSLDNIFGSDNDKLKWYDVRLFLFKPNLYGKSLSLINDVVIRNQNSIHITTVNKLIKQKLAPYIEEEDIRNYFTTIYQLPVYTAMNIKYQHAKFSGGTKDGFVDTGFGKVFEQEITNHFNNVEDAKWETLAKLISSAVENSFNLYYNKPATTNKIKNKLIGLGTGYYGCTVKNRMDAELFIVEGLSASHITAVREPYHAVYLIEGKPLNVIIDKNNLTRSIQLVERVPAYKELMDILNVYPRQTDLSNCQFGKIIISTDADSDGYHIASLHVGALWTINPLLLSMGFVYIANPPLYEMSVRGDRSKRKLLIKDRQELFKHWVEIYSKYIRVEYTSSATYGEMREFNESEFKGMAYEVLEVGEYLTEYSKQYAMSPVILEKLASITWALNPYAPDIEAIERALQHKVQYNAITKVLTVESRPVDIQISLQLFNESLYNDILPRLQQIKFKKLNLFVSTKNTNKYVRQPVTITQLYQLFTVFNDAFDIKRHKGLGGMDDDELTQAFIDPYKRRLTKITSIGDVDVLYGLLGVDTATRKELLVKNGLQVA